MALRKICAAGLLVLTTAGAIAAAPIAAAAPASGDSGAAVSSPASSGSGTPQSCLGLGGTQSVCQSPGNVQINDSPPQVDYFPYAGGAT